MSKRKKFKFQGLTIGPGKFNTSQIKFYLILLPFVAFMVLPIAYIFFHAVKPLDELFLFPPRFTTTRPTLDSFRNLLDMVQSTHIPLNRYLFNNIVVTVSVVGLSIIISVMAGYVLSKKNFKAKKALFNINMMALMFVPTAVLVPRYLVVSRIGIIDTYFGHILPMVAMPVGLFLIKQFIDQTPDALIEAAEIDGANDFYIIRKIIFPLVKPAIATLGIMAFQLSWNDTTSSRLWINDESMKTFAFYLETFLQGMEHNVAMQGMAAASALIMFIPNLVIFIFMQSKVMNTMAHSGIK